jgi:hypothetical protein
MLCSFVILLFLYRNYLTLILFFFNLGDLDMGKNQKSVEPTIAVLPPAYSEFQGQFELGLGQSMVRSSILLCLHLLIK